MLLVPQVAGFEVKLNPLPNWGDEPPSFVLHVISEALQTGDLETIDFSVKRYDALGEGTLHIKYCIPDEEEAS